MSKTCGKCGFIRRTFDCIGPCEGRYMIGGRMYPARDFKGYEDEDGFLCYGCAADKIEAKEANAPA